MTIIRATAPGGLVFWLHVSTDGGVSFGRGNLPDALDQAAYSAYLAAKRGRLDQAVAGLEAAGFVVEVIKQDEEDTHGKHLIDVSTDAGSAVE